MRDSELRLLRDAFPQWRITRMGTLLRADRDSFKSRLAQSPAVMLAVLADVQFREMAGCHLSQSQSTATGR